VNQLDIGRSLHRSSRRSRRKSSKTTWRRLSSSYQSRSLTLHHRWLRRRFVFHWTVGGARFDRAVDASMELDPRKVQGRYFGANRMTIRLVAEKGMRKRPRSLVGCGSGRTPRGQIALRGRASERYCSNALYCLLADVQVSGDFLVSKASYHTVGDLLLPFRELAFRLGSAGREVRQMLEGECLRPAITPLWGSSPSPLRCCLERARRRAKRRTRSSERTDPAAHRAETVTMAEGTTFPFVS